MDQSVSADVRLREVKAAAAQCAETFARNQCTLMVQEYVGRGQVIDAAELRSRMQSLVDSCTVTHHVGFHEGVVFVLGKLLGLQPQCEGAILPTSDEAIASMLAQLPSRLEPKAWLFIVMGLYRSFALGEADPVEETIAVPVMAQSADQARAAAESHLRMLAVGEFELGITRHLTYRDAETGAVAV